MVTLIKDRKIVANNWLLLKAGDRLPASGGAIVPLAIWQSDREALRARGDIGVWLDSHEGPEALAGDAQSLPLIAIHFPKFVDGRGYSSARLLRERYGFAGELRAIGDIQRDQLFDLTRCGFDAFLLRDGEEAEAALASFDTFGNPYQASVDRPLPLFRRRIAA